MQAGGAILTIPQVAARLQIAPKTALKLLNAGEIPGVKVGQRWRVTEEQLAEYLKREPA